MSKHTPGDWIMSPSGKNGKGGSFKIWRNDHKGGLDSEGRNIGFKRIANFVFSEADARLIAASPDLARALMRWCEFAKANRWTDEDHQTDGIGWITETEEALKKAGVKT